MGSDGRGTTSALALIDADALLSEEERSIRDTVRSYAESELSGHIAEWFETGHLPAKDIARGLGELGVLGMHLTGYGAAGTSAVAYGLACMELEAIDSGIRSLVSVQGSLAMFAIHRHGTDAQREHWLPGMATGELLGCFGLTEPDHGSNPSGMRTTARRVGVGDDADWIIDGTKMWITNGSIADVAIIWAGTDAGIRGFVVPTDTPGFSTRDVPHKLSLRASVTSELVLDGVRLPASAILPSAHGLGGPLSCLSEARFGIVFGALGAARACLDCAIDYSVTREQFDRPLAGFQLTQEKLANMSVELQKGFLLALHIGRMKDEKRVTPQMVSIGKLNNVRESLEIARQSRTILGGNGITLEYPVMRHANNLESVLTYEGTSEIHTLVIGEALTGVSAFR